MNKENTRVYIDSSLRSTIKDELIETSSTSIKEFCEDAVNDHCEELRNHTHSYRVMRKTIDYLTELNGVDERIPSTNIKPKLGSGRRNKEVRMEVHPSVKSTINDVEDDIGISHSKANAICVLYHANEYTDSGPESRRLDKTVKHMLSELKQPVSSFHRILGDYFSLFYDERLKETINNQQESFDNFSKIYVEEFMTTKAYNTVEKYYGPTTLNNTEQVINKHTEYNPNPECSITKK